MKEKINILYEKTIQLLDELEKIKKNDINREQIIANVQGMLNQRDQLIESIQEPHTEQDQLVGEEIISTNKIIKNRMDSLYDEIKKDIKNMQQRKEKNISYVNPYGKMTTEEGVYVDSRK